MKRKLSNIFKRWHRRLGIVSAFFVMVLAVTGLLLLFSGPMDLDRQVWNGVWISKAYNQAPKTEPVGILLGSGDWLVMVDGLVYIGDQNPITLAPPLVMAKKEERFVYAANNEETIVTLLDGTLVERIEGVAFTGTHPTPLPEAIINKIIKRYSGRGMPVSRVLLDIHTGRFFGAVGTWLMALASIFLVLLSLSGLYMWIRKPNGKKSRTG